MNIPILETGSWFIGFVSRKGAQNAFKLFLSSLMSLSHHCFWGGDWCLGGDCVCVYACVCVHACLEAVAKFW